MYDIVPSITYATCFNENPAELLLREKSAQDQRENLRLSKATHLLINWREIARYRSPGNYGFSSWPQRSDIERWIVDGIVERVEWPFGSEDAELFSVTSEKIGQRPPAPSTFEVAWAGNYVPVVHRSLQRTVSEVRRLEQFPQGRP